MPVLLAAAVLSVGGDGDGDVGVGDAVNLVDLREGDGGAGGTGISLLRVMGERDPRGGIGAAFAVVVVLRDSVGRGADGLIVCVMEAEAPGSRNRAVGTMGFLLGWGRG